MAYIIMLSGSTLIIVLVLLLIVKILDVHLIMSMLIFLFKYHKNP